MTSGSITSKRSRGVASAYKAFSQWWNAGKEMTNCKSSVRRDFHMDLIDTDVISPVLFPEGPFTEVIGGEAKDLNQRPLGYEYIAPPHHPLLHPINRT